MPKKTKKEKLISGYRKKIQLLQSFQTASYKSPENKIPAPVVAPHVNFKPTEEDEKIRHFFFIDLRKSLFIIGFILALEISLYFVSMYNNLRLGK